MILPRELYDKQPALRVFYLAFRSLNMLAYSPNT